MSVFIQNFKPGVAGKWTIMHDDAPGGSHSAQADATDISFGIGIDGQPDYRMMIVNCPVCDSTSTHPVGGGAQPVSVQEMAVRLIMRLGCPCGGMVAGRPALLALGHARTHVANQESLSRWQVASVIP